MSARADRRAAACAAPARDENGAVLVLTLVAVVFIATVFAAVASSEGTTFRVQKTLVDKRTEDLAADAAIDTVIAQLQTDLDAGKYDSSSPLGLNQTCMNLPKLNYTDSKLPKDMVVSCKPGNTLSRTVPGGELPENVIFATGGSYIDGDDSGELAEVNVPFCDDRGPTAGRCEAGVQIGASVGDGLLVASNGRFGTDPLVVSNGAIVAKPGGGLRVAGSVKARRGCPNVSVISAANPPTHTDISNGDVSTPFSQSEPGGGDSLVCEGATPANVASAMQPIELWKHNRWYDVDATVPEVVRPDPESPTRPILAPPVKALAEWDSADPALPGVARCQDHFMQFDPGTYRDLKNLNILMVQCPSTTFYFSPGTYYFDFADVAGEDAWQAPKQAALVIGGTPKGWSLPGPDVVQTKRMRSVSVGTNGPVTNATSGIVLDFSAVEATVDVPTNQTPKNATISHGTLRYPLPEGGTPPVVEIQSVRLRLAQRTLGGNDPIVTVKTGTATCEFDVETAASELDSDGVKAFNLFTSCPVSTAGSPTTSTNWPPTWTAQRVNDLGATLALSKTNVADTMLTYFDGMEYDIGYKGRPTPSFPGACDPTQPGVQFIFGDLSRIHFFNNDVYVDLCGSRGVPGTSPYGTAVFGLSEETTGPARVTSSALKNPSSARIYTNNLNSFNAQPLGGLPGFGNNGTTVASQVAVDPWEQIESAPGCAPAACTQPLTSAWTSWTQGATRTFSMTLDSQWIPAGSTIVKAEIVVAHAEPRINNSPLQAVPKLSVNPIGSANSDDDPDPAGTVSSTNLTPMNDAPLGLFDSSTNGLGHYPGPYQTDTIDVTQSLNHAAALNGAQINIAFSGAIDAANPKYAFIDGVEVRITYRPPTDLRPLRGCMTTRLGTVSEYSPFNLTLAMFSGVVGAQYTPFPTTDRSFYEGYSSIDKTDCAVLLIEANSTGFGTKTHIAGAVYAPTAAVRLAGKNNEEAFVTDGIVARHVDVVRFRDTTPGADLRDVAAFGGGVTKPRNPGLVLLEVRVDGTGPVIASATVKLIDPTTATQTRADAEIVEWRRRP